MTPILVFKRATAASMMICRLLGKGSGELALRAHRTFNPVWLIFIARWSTATFEGAATSTCPVPDEAMW